VLSACSLAYGYSNPIEGGSTETVTNHWNVAVPWLMVGSNTEGNSLAVTDGGQVNNQIGYIGNTAASSSNSALVTGAGSTWNSFMELSVGRDGSDNTLTVADGGRVYTPVGYIGNSSSGNQANITGTGSVLDSAILQVGRLAGDNDLNISDGGRVESASATLGYWIGADDNAATVQGSNSVWSNSGNLDVGGYGSGNQLVVDAGGRVESPVVNVGVQSISSNNTVTVTGSGSVLDAPEIHIGGSAAGAGGTGNRIEVENGGTVATTDLNIYAGNQFDLNSGGRLAVNTNFNASMSGFNFNSGGTLEVGGELTGMNSTIEDQRSIVMNGSEALWDRSGSILYVGTSSSGNTLTISAGGQIHNIMGYIGTVSGADSNAVLVSGGGSVWSNRYDLYVGFGGSGNTLEIADGGQVYSDYSFIGDNGSSSNNSVMVTGSGSVWSNRSNLYVGRYGLGNNTLEIADGGQVYNADGFIGYASAVGNNVMVTGFNSVWSNTGTLCVGFYGSGNALTVSGGGQVYSDYSFIGSNASSSNNSVMVTGSGSLWSNSSWLRVGLNPSFAIRPRKRLFLGV